MSVIGISLTILFCCPSYQKDRHGILYVVCTTSILADLVKNVAGNLVEVDYLMGPGVDPHVYRARESDMHKIAHADIVLYHGLHLEGKMATIFKKMGTKAVAVSDAIPCSLLRESDSAGIYDPHVWHDVSIWCYALAKVTDLLGMCDVAHKKIYYDNGERYRQKLIALDSTIRRMVSIIPEKRRVLITAHDAFGYFGAAYGFKVVGLQGISTDSEISTGDIQRIVALIVAFDVPAIFIESLIPERTLQAVQQAVYARGKKVCFGAELFSDALGDEASGANTYIAMMQHNVKALVEALG